jgi:flagellar export protein FliJ
MIRPDLLQRLIDRSRDERDQSAAESAKAKQALLKADETLQMLSNYRGECESRAPTLRPEAFDPVLLQRHAAFVNQLDTAVDDQRRRTEQSARIAAQRDQQLAARQRRLLAFELLQTRQRERAARRAERIDQANTDEMALNLLRATGQLNSNGQTS